MTADPKLSDVLRRCGLTDRDIVAIPYATFVAEVAREGLAATVAERVVAERFRLHQERVARNIQLVLTERDRETQRQEPASQLQPRPPSTELRIAENSKRFRERESRKQADAAARVKQIDTMEAARVRDLSELLRAQDNALLEAQEAIQILNAERLKARQERDEQIAALRRQLMVEKQQKPKNTLQEFNSPSPSPRRGPEPGTADKSVSRARENRAERDRQRLECLRQKLEKKDQMMVEFEARVELIAAEKREKFDRQAASARVAMDRAAAIRMSDQARREEVQELSATRGSLNLERQHSNREEDCARLAAAREACLQNAVIFREARARALRERFEVKQIIEAERLKDAQSATERQRLVQATVQSERVKHRETMVERLRKSASARGAEALLKLDNKTQAAEARRQILLNAAYD